MQLTAMEKMEAFREAWRNTIRGTLEDSPMDRRVVDYGDERVVGPLHRVFGHSKDPVRSQEANDIADSLKMAAG
jgi:hypothetical protein